MIYAQIAVKTKIPSIGKTYTYLIPEELEYLACIGCSVEVPFGKKVLEGIILNITTDAPDFAVKEVKKISPTTSLLLSLSLDIANWMSQRYISNIFDCLALMQPKGKQKKVTNINKKEILETDFLLSAEQDAALKKIRKIILSNKNKQILLHGVTGSGKTEIYLQLARQYIENGKQVLFMVPEIALTPQLISRFSKRFGSETIAVVHSKVQGSMRYQDWHDIKEGTKKVIIGSRSAILSPMTNLGLIIIDECHEQSYKQDKSPRYNAITTSQYISNKYDIPLVMGSATPLIEQYYDALHGDLHLIEMPTRVKGNFAQSIIVDLKNKVNKKYPYVSKTLLEKILEMNLKSEQSILYLNRRGLQTSLICEECGSYEKCPKCDMPLTIHQKQGKQVLVCHYCFFTKPMISICPLCQSKFLKGTGTGTQSIYNQITKEFPLTKVLIMDKDTTSKKGSHEEIYTRFSQHKADILIGTQMITKGLDIANVNLTSYMLLDSDLMFPSFRTSERVYQAIIQLGGRAGRSKSEAYNIIQTYNPQNPILQYAITNNYRKFYEEELLKRQQLNYPPFSYLIQIVSRNKSESSSLKALKRQVSSLSKELEECDINQGVHLLGPSKCFLYKVNNEYFTQYTIKIEKSKQEGENDLHIKHPIYYQVIKILMGMKKEQGININIDPFELQ